MTDSTNNIATDQGARAKLLELPTGELLAIHNGLADSLDHATLGSWKRSKATLVDRIESLQEDVSVATSVKPSHADDPWGVAEELEDEPILDVVVGTTSGRTIKAASIDWLCHVSHFENRDERAGPDNVVDAGHPHARSVGVPYDEIIANLRDEFPGCGTTVACLRWYAVKIRVEEFGYEGFRLPQRRPRSKAKS